MRVGTACAIALLSLACMSVVTFALQPKAGNVGLRQVYNYLTQGAQSPANADAVFSAIPPAFDMCTDAAGNLYFVADTYRTGTPNGVSHHIGKLAALTGTQFADPAYPSGSTYTGVSAVFTDVIDATPTYAGTTRSAAFFSPTGLACTKSGSLLTVDYQYDAAGTGNVNPAFAILSNTGSGNQMQILSDSEGKILRDSLYTDYLTGLVWDEVHNEVIYTSNCVYTPGAGLPPAPYDQTGPRNCGDRTTVTGSDQTGVQVGSWIGRYLQPGVAAAITPAGPGNVDIITSQSKNPNNNYDNANGVNDVSFVTSVLPSGAIKDADGVPIRLQDGVPSAWAYRSFFAYDKQRRQAYFGGRWNNLGETAVAKEQGRTVPTPIAPDQSTNPETQNAIWVQSQDVLVNQQNTRAPRLLWRDPNFDPANPDYVAAKKFQAVTLSPQGDLYFCAKDLADQNPGTRPSIYYFTASQLRSMESESSFTGTTQPATLTYSDARRTTGGAFEPSLPTACENLTFDPSGNLYLNDATNIFVISNLETKVATGTEFFSLPVVVQVFGKTVPARGAAVLP
jgi:hypothetical protein